jgi:subtilisin family serine protease
MAGRWRLIAPALFLVVSGLSAVPAQAGPAAGNSLPAPTGPPTDYTVLLAEGADHAAALAALESSGGTVLRENPAIGLVVVRAPRSGFAERVSAAPGVLGAARSRAIGELGTRQDRETQAATPAPAGAADAESGAPAGTATAGGATPAQIGMDPLDTRLFGLRMVQADLARQRQAGDPRVTVGVLDSGVDASHPDLAPNVDLRLSRNFVVDIPYDENGEVVDGPCEFDGCVDPAGYDDYGHGTHVAGTIAAAANGFGVSGVAPRVTLVDLRVAQDSGYVFLQPFLDALTYGADLGLNVMNLVFEIDPWVFNCTGNPADTPEQRLEQRTTIEAVNRALDYAHRKGVTMVAEIGYTHDDLGHPHPDQLSPDFPSGASYPRELDNSSCLAMPVEGHHVIAVSSVGPSGAKEDFSNYGLEQVSLAAPGGYRRDGFGTAAYFSRDNQILSTYSRAAATGKHWLTPEGEITELGLANGMVKHCQDALCSYFRWAEGTDRAAPHVSGVAALVISQYGNRGRDNTPAMSPERVEHVLLSTARAHPCPTPRLVSYADVGRTPDWDAYCDGDTSFNGFYGHGIVDALAAVSLPGSPL